MNLINTQSYSLASKNNNAIKLSAKEIGDFFKQFILLVLATFPYMCH